MTQPPHILIVELLAAGRGDSWHARHVKLPNFHGVMATSVAAWCVQLGADVTYRTYTGNETLKELLQGEWDVVFLAGYTRTAWTATEIARRLRARGTITVLGGPHAIAYPDDARQHFDYVVGLCDRDVLAQIVDERRPARGEGAWLSANAHPTALPTLRERAPFVDAAVAKARLVRVVPLLASIGCPYTCSFCSDAEVAWRRLDEDGLTDDVRFAHQRWPGALLFFHDPNFAIRFDATLSAIERGLDGRQGRFGAESSLSILSPDRLPRLAEVGFEAMLPGIEDWSPDRKSGDADRHGRDKMLATAEAVRGLLAHIPYVQVNLIIGLDGNGPAEAALTREFAELVPGAWPNLNLYTAYGRASPAARALEAAGRVLPVPFPLLDQKTVPNVVTERPLADLLRELLDLLDLVASPRLAWRRLHETRGTGPRLMNLMRAWGGEQRARVRWYRTLLDALETDRGTREFFAGDSKVVPPLLEALARSVSAA